MNVLPETMVEADRRIAELARRHEAERQELEAELAGDERRIGHGPTSSSPWVAHDEPERPLDYGCWVCDCRACAIALEAAARRSPALELVVKLERAPRVRISVVDYLACGGADAIAGADDYVREVFVARGAGEVVR